MIHLYCFFGCGCMSPLKIKHLLASSQSDDALHVLWLRVENPICFACGHTLRAGTDKSFEFCFVLNFWNPYLLFGRCVVQSLDGIHAWPVDNSSLPPPKQIGEIHSFLLGSSIQCSLEWVQALRECRSRVFCAVLPAIPGLEPRQSSASWPIECDNLSESTPGIASSFDQVMHCGALEIKTWSELTTSFVIAWWPMH